MLTFCGAWIYCAVSTAHGGTMSDSVDKQQLVRYKQKRGMYTRLLDEASEIVRCSDNKTAAKVRPREYAMRWPYMQVNSKGKWSWMVFDLDHIHAMVWQTAGLPPPNIIVRNPVTGKSHLYYAIKPVLRWVNARGAPQKYFEAVYEAYADKLDADPCYRGPVAKTPGHAWWETLVLHERVYHLGDLGEYVELKLKSRRRKTEEQKNSRNCKLFDKLRFYAYDIVERERSKDSYSRFINLLDVFADENNNFKAAGHPDGNLSCAEVDSTVRSVARWTWDHYVGSRRCRRGIMNLSDALPLDVKQRLSAERTHVQRRQSTGAKIQAACELLRRGAQPLTLAAVAKAAGLARQTVAKHRALLEPYKRLAAVDAAVPATPATDAAPISARGAHLQGTASTAMPDVNFGVHQVFRAAVQ